MGFGLDVEEKLIRERLRREYKNVKNWFVEIISFNELKFYIQDKTGKNLEIEYESEEDVDSRTEEGVVAFAMSNHYNFKNIKGADFKINSPLEYKVEFTDQKSSNTTSICRDQQYLNVGKDWFNDLIIPDLPFSIVFQKIDDILFYNFTNPIVEDIAPEKVIFDSGFSAFIKVRIEKSQKVLEVFRTENCHEVLFTFCFKKEEPVIITHEKEKSVKLDESLKVKQDEESEPDEKPGQLIKEPVRDYIVTMTESEENEEVEEETSDITYVTTLDEEEQEELKTEAYSKLTHKHRALPVNWGHVKDYVAWFGNFGDIVESENEAVLGIRNKNNVIYYLYRNNSNETWIEKEYDPQIDSPLIFESSSGFLLKCGDLFKNIKQFNNLNSHVAMFVKVEPEENEKFGYPVDLIEKYYLIGRYHNCDVRVYDSPAYNFDEIKSSNLHGLLIRKNSQIDGVFDYRLYNISRSIPIYYFSKESEVKEIEPSGFDSDFYYKKLIPAVNAYNNAKEDNEVINLLEVRMAELDYHDLQSGDIFVIGSSVFSYEGNAFEENEEIKRPAQKTDKVLGNRIIEISDMIENFNAKIKNLESKKNKGILSKDIFEKTASEIKKDVYEKCNELKLVLDEIMVQIQIITVKFQKDEISEADFDAKIKALGDSKTQIITLLKTHTENAYDKGEKIESLNSIKTSEPKGGIVNSDGKGIIEDKNRQSTTSITSDKVGKSLDAQADSIPEISQQEGEKKDEPDKEELPDIEIDQEEIYTGERVYLEEHEEIKTARVLMGDTTENNEKLYWQLGNKRLANRHMLITGKSGMGKTYFMQCILYELSRQGISSVVFDYSESYTNDELQKTGFLNLIENNFEQIIVKRDKISINPFRRYSLKIAGDYLDVEENIDVASRISDSMKKIFSFGDQQVSALDEAILNGLRKYKSKMNIHRLEIELQNVSGMYQRSAKSVLSKIKRFLEHNPFASEKPFSWKELIESNGKINIIQLSGYSDESKRLITEFLLWDAWYFMVRNGNEKTPLVVALDEAQNLSFKKSSPTGKILTEGRKFGFSGIFALQFAKGQLNKEEIGRIGQAETRVLFKPSNEDIPILSKTIDPNDEYSDPLRRDLRSLKKGECIVNGGLLGNSIYKKIHVTSLNDRALGITEDEKHHQFEEKKLENIFETTVNERQVKEKSELPDEVIDQPDTKTDPEPEETGKNENNALKYLNKS